MSRSGHALLSILLATGLVGCVSSPTLPAPPMADGCSEQRSDRLLFGMNAPDGAIDDAEWNRFLADTVTPRFPDGLTVYRAQGQWRGQGGEVEREESRAVEIIHAGDAAGRTRINEIVAAYKARYRQESVLVISQRVVACF